jgi:hypothetical protein
MIVSKSQSQATLPEERSRRLTSCTIGDSVLYHSLSGLKDDRKKKADAIEFCEVDDAVSAIFASRRTLALPTRGRAQP